MSRDSDRIIEAEFDESQGGFEMFRRRAASLRGGEDATWRVGFDPAFRDGWEEALADHLVRTLLDSSPIVPPPGAALVDIGSGSGPLPDAISDVCAAHQLIHVLIDSLEMLQHVNLKSHKRVIAGRFPANISEILSADIRPTFVLAYSVMQYVIRESDPSAFVDAACSLLPEGGVALFGDLPNRDMRDRQYAASGRAAPAAVTSEIRDQFLLNEISRLRHQGLHAYLIPQSGAEAMRLHRENMLVVRPASQHENSGITER